MLLVRSLAAPAAGGIRHTFTRGGLVQTAAILQDTGRGFSAAFPGFPTAGAHVTSLNHGRLTVPALRMQLATKATVPRDPERPKRPLSAYFRFGADLRTKQQGKLDARAIGQAWAKLSAVDKQPFQQAAEADKAVFDRKFEDYKASGKMDAFKRDPAKPKKPLTPFFIWAQQERKTPQIANLPVSEAAKAMGASWKNIAADKKAPMQKQYEAEMVQYNAAMKTYKDSGTETAWLERTGRLEIVKKAEAKKQAKKDKLMEDKDKKKLQEAAAKEKAKAAAAKEKEKESEAKAKDKAKAKAVSDKAKKDAAAKKSKAKLAFDKKKSNAAKAKATLEKKKAKRALDRTKAKEAAEKKKATAKAAAEKKKAAKSARATKAKTARSQTVPSRAAKSSSQLRA